MMTGLLLIPWQLSGLFRRSVADREFQSSGCGGCGLARHDTDAQHCKVCGTALGELVDRA